MDSSGRMFMASSLIFLTFFPKLNFTLNVYNKNNTFIWSIQNKYHSSTTMVKWWTNWLKINVFILKKRMIKIFLDDSNQKNILIISCFDDICITLGTKMYNIRYTDSKETRLLHAIRFFVWSWSFVLKFYVHMWFFVWRQNGSDFKIPSVRPIWLQNAALVTSL